MGRVWMALVLVAGCAEPRPLGVYRLALPTAAGGVELRTVLARTEGAALVLYDGRDGHELGRTAAAQRWDGEAVPFRLEAIDLTLYVRDGVIEDRSPKRYTRLPATPLVLDVDSVRRVTLASGGATRELVVAGEAIFAETPEPQPAAGLVPGPLELLGSVAGTGLWLSPLAEGAEWRDEMSARVPPDPAMAVPCGAPIASLTRVLALAPLDVPAGRISAWTAREVVDTCRQPNPPPLAVFAYERAFAPELGPARLAFTGADAKTWTWVLVSSDVRGGSGPWPLESGNAWSYELRDPLGAPAGGLVEVRVAGSRLVGPRER